MGWNPPPPARRWPEPPRPQRNGSVICEGCGAKVDPHEHACSYCTRVPSLSMAELMERDGSRKAEGIPAGADLLLRLWMPGLLDVTTINDVRRMWKDPRTGIVREGDPL